jgi:YHS domain-containing protein
MHLVALAAACKSEYRETACYFCFSGCKESFDTEPGKYLSSAATAHAQACC